MQGITSENVHYWNPKNPFYPNTILLDIPEKGLVSATDTDHAINYLYLNGFKQSAREINQHNKRN